MILLSRDEFRNEVFIRDSQKCVVCEDPAADAHHVIERRLWTDGGYYLENGASLCPKHHIEAEQTTLACEDLRAAAGITVIALPPHFDREERYDKWGNVFLPNGLRVRGELFYDESVQIILKQGGVLGQFTKYVKFPKISHLPWSPGVDERTDRVFTKEEVEKNFGGQEVVVTEKMDGENTSMYRDYVHARSLNSRNHPSRNWVKNLHAGIAHEIPEDWRICGENLYATHSLHYRNLPSFFMVFAIYNEKNECLSWDDVVDSAQILDLKVVPLLYRGPFDEDRVQACFTGKSACEGSEQEGYVLRLASAIQWSKHRYSFAKFVRKGHVQTAHGWMHRAVEPNEMKK
ncbi:MAG: RNA ligase family protein [bacterium]